MATDTARVQLELASGRNEITAPFHQTAQRRRQKQVEADDAESVDAPAAAATIVNVPLAAALPPAPATIADPEISHEQRGGRTPWIAFAIALVSVGFAVWWVMAQRMPDIDPRDVIARNIDDARTAMAEGRYSDPPERSAFHYYSTVLALDPANADAIAGIDAIADRHVTNARVLLAQKRIAEAGVALEKARRVRPDHNGLEVLDAQWRAELKQMLAAATTVAKPEVEMLQKLAVAKTREVAASRPALVAAPEVAAPAPTSKTSGAGPEIKAEPAPLPEVAEVAIAAATLPANQTTAPAVPEPVAEPVATPAPAAEPKLIKMVQPQYPQEALMRGLEGWVDVSLQISATGDVVAPRVEDSSRGRMFNRAALEAVEQWKYEPRGDSATSDRVRVRLKFQRSN